MPAPVAMLPETVPDRCPWCRNDVDRETCHCGGASDEHHSTDGHSFTPMGCQCGYFGEPRFSVPVAIGPTLARVEVCCEVRDFRLSRRALTDFHLDSDILRDGAEPHYCACAADYGKTATHAILDGELVGLAAKRVCAPCTARFRWVFASPFRD